MSKQETPLTLLKHYQLSPRKSLGQNFLVEPGAPARIAAQAGLTPADTVLEVGAGLGTLTTELAQHAGQVLAVETDPHLLPALRAELAAYTNATVIHGDILQLDPAALLNATTDVARPLWGALLPTYCVVANLPYYITAAVLRHLFEARVRPRILVVTVQREVAQRMVAQPNAMSLLAVSVQFYGRPRILFRLKRGAFYPPPAVESAVVLVESHAEPPVPVAEVARFFRVVRAGFAQKRKQLRNTLATLGLSAAEVAAALATVGIDATRRAETLSLAEWASATQALTAPLEWSGVHEEEPCAAQWD